VKERERKIERERGRERERRRTDKIREWKAGWMA
jgi:hypothetical protein